MTPANVVARASSLASLPASYQHITEAINRPDSNAAAIADAIRTDQSLATRVLRISNSPYFGYAGRVDNLHQAVVTIGTRQILDLMSATVAIQKFAGISPELIDMKAFWRHSLACGVAARAFAQLRGDPNPERLFTAGLLHDIGSLVLYQFEAEQALVALRQHRHIGMPLEAAEREIFGFDHTEVGERLLSEWRFPNPIRAAAAEHHRATGESQFPGTVCIIHVADLLVHALDLGTNGEGLVPQLSPSAWQWLGQPTGALGVLAERMRHELEEVEELFLR